LSHVEEIETEDIEMIKKSFLLQAGSFALAAIALVACDYTGDANDWSYRGFEAGHSVSGWGASDEGEISARENVR